MRACSSCGARGAGAVQQTHAPWLACRISTFKTSRVPFEKSDDSFNHNKRAFLSAGLTDANQNMTRVASSRKKRAGPNRSDETLHSAAQEQNYQNRELKRPRIEEEDLTTEPDWDQFRCSPQEVSPRDLRETIIAVRASASDSGA